MRAKRGKSPTKTRAKVRPKPKPKPKANKPRPTVRAKQPAGPADSQAAGLLVVFDGGCHCGAIEFTYATAVPARRWPVQTCQCAFCRGHGARSTADPAGEVHFDFKLPEHLRRYRFGLRTADFLVCRDCGTYVAAVLMTGRGALACINVNTLREPPRGTPPGKAILQQGDSTEERRARRARLWTPVVGPV